MTTTSTTRPHQGTHRPATEGPHQEEMTMTLTELIDHRVADAAGDGAIPCQDNDAELWFADTPEGVELDRKSVV